MPPWARELWARHRGKLVGATLGAGFGLLWRWVGLFWALVIAVLAGLGYWLGRRYDEDPEAFLAWLERVLARRGG